MAALSEDGTAVAVAALADLGDHEFCVSNAHELAHLDRPEPSYCDVLGEFAGSDAAT